MQENITANIETAEERHAEAFRREAFKTTWKVRTQTLWAGGILGLGFGAVTGLLTALAGIAVGATGILLPVVAAFAVGGMMTGIVGFTAAGAAAGAIDANAKIQDHKHLIHHPGAALAENAAQTEEEKPKKTFWNYVIPFTQGSKQIFNVRTALIFGLGGLALGGLLLLSGAVGLGLLAIKGLTLAPAAIHAMTLTACTAFGLAFGVDVPTMGANANEFIGRLFSGKPAARQNVKIEKRAQDAIANGATLGPSDMTITQEDMDKMNSQKKASNFSFTEALAQQNAKNASEPQTTIGV